MASATFTSVTNEETKHLLQMLPVLGLMDYLSGIGIDKHFLLLVG